MKSKEFILHEKMRGDCYRFLSACFYLPEKETFLDGKLLENLSASLKDICPQAYEPSMEMQKGILSYSNKELAVEYARLFVGPFELKSPPYGSVYLDGGRRVMGDSTMEVIKTYEEEGLSRDSEFKELPDHIAVELEFMYYLVFKEIQALEKCDIRTAFQFKGKQEKFQNRFLRQWAPLFCEKVKEGTDNKFYMALADCLFAFIMNSQLSDNAYEKYKEVALSS
ncbi:MAG: molecular chaperone TorD family protein [Nitrospirae bacterium]|nr:molecular chaperone TorD family protein [Nitrospirota bacterium]